MSDTPKSPLLTKEQAAEYLRIPVRTLAFRRCANKGPAYRKVGRNVFYHLDDLDEYIDQCKVDPNLRGNKQRIA